MKSITINDLKVGTSATVMSIKSVGAMKRRLIDMGITPGVKIFLKKIAPLGDPLQISLRGYELSIRREEAKQIYVSKENSND